MILKAGLVFLLMGGTVEMAHAQKMKQIGEPIPYDQIDPDWQDCGLRKIDVNTFTSVRLPKRKQARKAATIDVTYNGFSNEAREAFQRAVDIWETHLDSDVTIRIDATFTDLGDNVLGGTRPSSVYAVDTDGNGDFDTVFGDALFDAITGEDQGSGNDIIIEFNEGRDDWHFGEEDAPSGTIDFTSVVLHEIAHGLDYFDVTTVEDDGTGRYGNVDFDGDGNPDGIPYVFTRFLAREPSGGSPVPLTDESEFPNPSQELGDALTSNGVVFDGSRANLTADQSTGPVPPKIYAPASYSVGSSIAHLDESTYSSGSENALMTPRVNTAETNRLPGPIACGQLADMGWPLGSDCLQYFQDITALQIAGSSESTDASVTLTWEERDKASIQGYAIEQSSFGGDFQEVEADIEQTGASSFKATVDSLGLGQFVFRVRWTNSDGSEGVSVQELDRTVTLAPPSTSVSRDETGRGTVDLSWSVPPGTESGSRTFTYRIEQAPGVGDDYQEVGSTSQKAFTSDRQTPGQYQYRVVAEESGNEVVGNSTSVDISFEGAVFISGPFPNPVQDQARVELTAKDAQEVSVGIYNTIGQRVYFEERELRLERPTRFSFDSRRWGSGMYFLHVTGEEFTKTRKMVVVH